MSLVCQLMYYSTWIHLKQYPIQDTFLVIKNQSLINKNHREKKSTEEQIIGRKEDRSYQKMKSPDTSTWKIQMF